MDPRVAYANWARTLKTQPTNVNVYSSRVVILNLGSIEPQVFGEPVSGVRWRSLLFTLHAWFVTSRSVYPSYIFFQLWRVRWMHEWNLRGSVQEPLNKTQLLIGKSRPCGYIRTQRLSLGIRWTVVKGPGQKWAQHNWWPRGEKWRACRDSREVRTHAWLIAFAALCMFVLWICLAYLTRIIACLWLLFHRPAKAVISHSVYCMHAVTVILKFIAHNSAPFARE